MRLVGRPDLGALVSDLDADALSAPKAVRAHWRVLEEASASATVVPVRFGMVMADDDAVRARLLEANEPALAALLRELAGKVQLTVKGEYDEEGMLREVVRSDARRRRAARPQSAASRATRLLRPYPLGRARGRGGRAPPRAPRRHVIEALGA